MWNNIIYKKEYEYFYSEITIKYIFCKLNMIFIYKINTHKLQYRLYIINIHY